MNISKMLQAGIDASQAASGAAQFNAALDSMSSHTETSLGKIENALGRISSSVFNLRSLLATVGVGAVIKDVMNAQMQFNSIFNTLEASVGGVTAARVEYKLLSDTVKKLGMDLPTTALQFAQISAAAMGTSLTGETLRRVFLGVSMAATGLHMDANRTQLVLYAMQQMISKGVVSMQELRRQMGDNMVGAFQMAAEAMGVTTSQMNKLVKSGKVLSADFLPKFGEVLIARFKHAAEAASNMTQNLINKLKTAFFELKLYLVSNGLGATFDDTIKKLIVLVNSDEVKQAAKALGEFLGQAVLLLGNAFIFVGTHGKTVLGILGAFVGLKTVMFMSNLYTQLMLIKDALLAIEAVQMGKAFLGGMMSKPNIIMGTGVTPIAARGLFTKNGTLLNASQFAMKNAAGHIGEEEAAMYSAMTFLRGKGGQLGQTALNAKLAGNAFKGMSAVSKVNIASAAEDAGLAISLGMGTKAMAVLQSATAAVVAQIGRLGIGAGVAGETIVGSATTGGVALQVLGTAAAAVAGAVTLPFTVAAVAVGAAAVGAYVYRDSLIEVAGHSARLKDYLAVLWSPFQLGLEKAVQGLKYVGSAITHYFTSTWSDLKYLTGEYIKDIINFMSRFEWVRKWAEAAEARRMAQTPPDLTIRTNTGVFSGTGPHGSSLGQAAFDQSVELKKLADKQRADAAAADDPNERTKRDRLRQYNAELDLEISKYNMLLSLENTRKGNLVEIAAKTEVLIKLNAMREGATPAQQSAIEAAKNSLVEKAVKIAKDKELLKARTANDTLMSQLEAEAPMLERQYDDLKKLNIATTDWTQSTLMAAAEQEAFNKTKELDGIISDGDLVVTRQQIALNFLKADSVKRLTDATRESSKAYTNAMLDAANSQATIEAISKEGLSKRKGYRSWDDQKDTVAAQAKAYADKMMKDRQGVGLSPENLALESGAWQKKYVSSEYEKHMQSMADWADGVRKSVGSMRYFEDEKKRLDEALAIPGDAFISIDEYNKALRDLYLAQDKAIDEQLMKTQTWQGGFTTAMREISRSAQDSATTFKTAFDNAFGSLQTQLVNLLDTGHFKFGDFLKSVQHEINTAFVKRMSGTLMDAILGGDGNKASGAKGPSFTDKLMGKGGTKLPSFTVTDPAWVSIAGGSNSLTGLLDPNKKTAQDAAALAAADSKTASKELTTNISRLGTVVNNGMNLFARGLSLLGTLGAGGGGGWMDVLMAGVTGFMGSFFGPHALKVNGGSIPGGMDVKAPDISGMYTPGPFPIKFRNGGIMTSNGLMQLRRFAKGGIQPGGSPALAMYGEGDQNEAYVPLPDGRRIPVAMSGNNAPPTVNIKAETHVYNQSSGEKDIKSTSRFDGQKMITEIWINDLQSEGPMSQAMRTYMGAR